MSKVVFTGRFFSNRLHSFVFSCTCFRPPGSRSSSVTLIGVTSLNTEKCPGLWCKLQTGKLLHAIVDAPSNQIAGLWPRLQPSGVYASCTWESSTIAFTCVRKSLICVLCSRLVVATVPPMSPQQDTQLTEPDNPVEDLCHNTVALCFRTELCDINCLSRTINDHLVLFSKKDR